MIAWDQASSHIAAFAKAAARDLANWAQVVDNMVSNVVALDHRHRARRVLHRV